ncbi:MAG: hypothetical protein MI919_05390 [Holophagales bacterium]|nr:hypothetical protein [Holophagales bacterium]
MESIRIPQRQVDVRVKIFGGQELNGLMYVPETGPDGGPGRLLERLNLEEQMFIPLTAGDKTHLVQRDQILLIRVDDEAEEDAEDAIAEDETYRHLEVRVRLTSGDTFTGSLFYKLPPDQERLQDYLNLERRRFIPLHVGRLVYLNRFHIVSAQAIEGE